MSSRRPSARSAAIRDYILAQTRRNPADLVTVTADKFAITHEGARQHVARLVREGMLEASGTTRARRYRLAESTVVTLDTDLGPGVEEHRIWQDQVRPHVPAVKPSVFEILSHGFAEMVNNAIDHSGGHQLDVVLRRTAADLTLVIRDDGVGVFERIKTGLGLPTANDAAVELSKGKVTTDPTRHTGEGIFFTSRAVDHFELEANALWWSWEPESKDLVVEPRTPVVGTTVTLRVSSLSHRTLASVFARYEGPDHRFSKTQVPVIVARLIDEGLVSRSAARRLLSRLERFEEVVLDFSGVSSIGQAFADEIFRVYPQANPAVRISAANQSRAVSAMVKRAQAEAGSIA